MSLNFDAAWLKHNGVTNLERNFAPRLKRKRKNTRATNWVVLAIMGLGIGLLKSEAGLLVVAAAKGYLSKLSVLFARIYVKPIGACGRIGQWFRRKTCSAALSPNQIDMRFIRAYILAGRVPNNNKYQTILKTV